MAKPMSLPELHRLADRLDDELPPPWRVEPVEDPPAAYQRSPGYRVMSGDRVVCLVANAAFDRDQLEMLARRIAALPALVVAARMGQAALPDAWHAVGCGVPKEVVQALDAAIRDARGLLPAPEPTEAK